MRFLFAVYLFGHSRNILQQPKTKQSHALLVPLTNATTNACPCGCGSSLTRFGHTTIMGTVLSLFDAPNISEHGATAPYIWAVPKVQAADAA
jgi:hypothetical protein